MRDRRRVLRVAADLRRAEREGADGLRHRQQARLDSLVAHAMLHSPHFRDLYAHIPSGPVALRDLPVTDKPSLMARFDDWVTDGRVRLDDLDTFVADPTLSGVPYLGEYFVCRSSGTSGHPGIFVADRGAIAVTYAVYGLGAARLLRRARLRRLVAGRMRQARIVGTAGHFAGAAMVELEHGVAGARTGRERVISPDQPLADLVAELNAFQPAIIQTYPSVVRQLAAEQRAGRLRLHVGLIGTGGESVSIEERARMAATFGAPVIDGYACSECLLLSATCPFEWLHYRSDWMVLEPVDDDHRPVRAGEYSRTVLLTDLSNRVQPIIRYDLGDSVLVRPDPCECGSPLPAIRVTGRSDDILRFAADGETVEVLPLVITAAAEGIQGLERVQLCQTGPARLTVRTSSRDEEQAADVRRSVAHAVRAGLDRLGVHDVAIDLEDLPQDVLGASGKFRQVIGQHGPLERR